MQLQKQQAAERTCKHENLHSKRFWKREVLKKDSQNKTVKEEELAEESAASLRLTLVSFLFLLALLSFLLLLLLVVAWFL